MVSRLLLVCSGMLLQCSRWLVYGSWWLLGDCYCVLDGFWIVRVFMDVARSGCWTVANVFWMVVRVF